MPPACHTLSLREHKKQSVLNRFDHSASKSETTHALPECDDPSGRIYQILNKLQYRLIPYLQNSMDLFDEQKDAYANTTNFDPTDVVYTF